MPRPRPPKPDSAEVKSLIEKARKAGGPMWAEEVHFSCEAGGMVFAGAGYPGVQNGSNGNVLLTFGVE